MCDIVRALQRTNSGAETPRRATATWVGCLGGANSSEGSEPPMERGQAHVGPRPKHMLSIGFPLVYGWGFGSEGMERSRQD